MKKLEIPRKWLVLMIGLCIFSIAAVIFESNRLKPDGWVIDTTAIHAIDAANSDLPIRNMSPDQSKSAMSNPATSNTFALDSISGNSQDNLVPVYLVGAVVNPGIYQVIRGSYLYQLIDQAGGLRSDAAAEEINLAEKITANTHIRIPTQDEYLDQPNYAWTTGETSNQPALINLNTATIDQLDTLPGIGPATAKAIVDFRERNGPFTDKTGLMRVAGIKQSRYDAIVEMIEVN